MIACWRICLLFVYGLVDMVTVFGLRECVCSIVAAQLFCTLCCLVF